ncbi:MAG TPA: sigma 54-interacting transcriptional regulator [Bryobacteraceae bacterium]|nr:sigma 54-interacting transcriptional regulator [Bryobacteraceae bacterium]
MLIGTESQKYALLLRTWEAINTERALPGVLVSLSEVLLPLVPYDSTAIIAYEEGGRHNLYAMHVPGRPMEEGETLETYGKRLAKDAEPLSEVRPLVPYPAIPPTDDKLRAEPYVCDDLLEKETWYEHDFHLAASGVRTYVVILLVVNGKLHGSAVFTRTAPLKFTQQEISILREVSRPLAVAVANALANEEIRRLRDQLEAENISLREQLGQAPWFEELVGASVPLLRVRDRVEQVAVTDATVLITGETGTGKELIARAIHRRSARAHGPLVKVNCAAIPETLLASELFGHERGAFTGAIDRRKGRFEQAHGGTLFLDEIGELTPSTQVMLLRVLQEREFERLGGSQTLQTDVRLIAATNRDLGEDVRGGRFRGDLYYRLNVFPVHMPALRERTGDIPALVAHFASKHGERFGKKISRIDRRSIHALQSCAWPGNVRELENAIERAVILSERGTLTVDRDSLASAPAQANIGDRLRSQERETIETALQETAGRVSGVNGAARRLGMAASTLEFRIKRLGIDKFRYRESTAREYAS